MSTGVAAGLALGLYGAGLIVTFGVRSWAHRRRTGSSGFRGLSGAFGSVEWWGGALFAAALVLSALGPALALAGLVEAFASPEWVRWVGLLTVVAALVGVLVAQAGMGASWRVGVDAEERTGLVTTGPFAKVRNPVFTAMIAALLGLTLMVPGLATLAGLLALVVAVELQVRFVEEPYLVRVHGPAYLSYARTAGRFVPGLGRLLSVAPDRR
ncbi:methyltransferase family protein [Georgenia subflava]|uniref:Isoprenylcysteine carboxylmethyltransferase family protein n=2 Tax=Georgenia subflava TaxID=1622177 RepID=A0A6N7EP24_9MICO|nr:isoprenylcysteine carboxylmethyltransferase family protein [Georgenia subflava]MPV37896.1 isoprenylcysteine carboxylmethyltransferase family protein [Georgenia subflava]